MTRAAGGDDETRVLLIDAPLTYRTELTGTLPETRLHVRIYETPEGLPAVIFTNHLLPENPGRSLINSFEQAAALVLRRWLPHRIGQTAAFLAIQHYPRKPGDWSLRHVSGYTRVRFADYDVRPAPGYESQDNATIGQVEWVHDAPVSHRFLQTLVGEAIANAPVDEQGNEY